jgi:hypothetical protein
VIVFFWKFFGNNWSGDGVFSAEKWDYYGTTLFFLVKKWIFSTGRWIFLSKVKKRVDLLLQVGYIPALEILCRTG